MFEPSELTMQPELGPALYLPDGREVKHGIRRNFARRARSYDRHACIQRCMAHGLVAVACEVMGRPRRILEIGCGTGGFSRAMIGHREATDAVLTDVSTDMLRICRRHLDRLCDAAV